MENNSNSISPLRKKLKESSLFLLDILYNAAIIIILVILIRTFLVSPFRVVGTSMVDTLEDKEFILIDKLSYIVGNIDRGDPIVFLPPIMANDKPKFEEVASTNSEGEGRLELGELKTEKLTSYCKNKILHVFWFCTSKPTESDLIYLTPQNSINPEQNGVKRLVLGKDEIKQGYLTFKGEADVDYDIKIYDDQGPEYFVKRVIGIPGDTVKIENGRVYVKGATEESFNEIDESFLNEKNFHHTYVNQSEEENTFVVPAGHYFVMGDNRQGSNDSRSWREPVTQELSPFVPEESISGKVMIVLWPLSEMRLIRSANF